MKILAAGDIHGGVPHVAYLTEIAVAQQVDLVIAVGDTGYKWRPEFIAALQALAEAIDGDVYWVDGNHDDHELIEALMGALGASYDAPIALWPDTAPNVLYVPRGCLFDLDGLSALGVGGAVSVDANARQDFVEYWPQEMITYSQLYRAESRGRVDVLFSHDVPAGTEPIERRLTIRNASERDHAARSNRQALHAIVETARPRLLVHGHYHHRYDGLHRCDDGYQTQVIGLGRDGQGADSWVIVDSDLWKR